MMSLQVDCQRAGPGWSCAVTVGTDAGATRHQVEVSSADLERHAPGDLEPTRLVRSSFEFLLEREPRESILRTFELPVIGRYFPEWEAEIRGRLSGS